MDTQATQQYSIKLLLKNGILLFFKSKAKNHPFQMHKLRVEFILMQRYYPTVFILIMNVAFLYFIILGADKMAIRNGKESVLLKKGTVVYSTPIPIWPMRLME